MSTKHLLRKTIYGFVKLRIYISSKQSNAEKQFCIPSPNLSNIQDCIMKN